MQKHASHFPQSVFFVRPSLFPILFFFRFEHVYLIDNRLFQLFWSLVYIITFFVFLLCGTDTHFPQKPKRIEYYLCRFLLMSSFAVTQKMEREKNVKKKKKRQPCLTISIFKRLAFSIQPHAFNNSFDCLSLDRQTIITVTSHLQTDVTKFNTS